MNLKKAAALIFAAILCVVFCAPAYAAEWIAEDFTLTVPDEFIYTFTPELSADDPTWVLAGVSDPSSTLEDYADMGVIADFRTEDGTSIKMREQSSDTAESIYNLNVLSEDDLNEFMTSVLQSNSEDVTVLTESLLIDGFPFCRYQVDGYTEEGDAHNIFYLTVLNGRSVVIDLYTGEDEITDEQNALLLSMVNSIKITQILPVPEAEPINAIVILGLLAIILIIVVAPFVYMPIKTKQDKKQKAKMAERLSAYHAQYGENPAMGEARFVNETDCTREAIRTFSLYHSYVNGLTSLAIGAGMCIVAVVIVFLFNMTWWLKLAAVAVAVYYAYKAIAMPGTIEKIQRKVFGRGVSTTARFTFFDEGFRVAGIQSASIYPYFQIIAVRKHGHYLYLYYDNDNAYLVDQYGFTLGEFNEFEKFIKEKTAKQEEK